MAKQQPKVYVMYTDPASGRPYWSDGQDTRWEHPNAGAMSDVPPHTTAHPYALDQLQQQRFADSRHAHTAVVVPVVANEEEEEVVQGAGPGNNNLGEPLNRDSIVWSSPVYCPCGEPGICCFSATCPCISYQTLVDKGTPRLGGGDERMLLWWSFCCLPMLCGCPPQCCVAEAETRKGFKGIYVIRDDWCWFEDYFMACLCQVCTLTQMHRHMNRFPLDRNNQGYHR
jgi:Cys-rich protein (TIGR01571 family)